MVSVPHPSRAWQKFPAPERQTGGEPAEPATPEANLRRFPGLRPAAHDDTRESNQHSNRTKTHDHLKSLPWCAGLVPFVNDPCMINYLKRTSEDDQSVNDRVVILTNVPARIKGVTKMLQERGRPRRIHEA